MFDYVVVGKGLIGSAALRYLTQKSKNVAAIGPDEPQEPWPEHAGVFGSHYDQGRITRQLDSTHVWAKLAVKSIAEYKKIEQESGQRFYYPCGCIQVGPTSAEQNAYIAQTEQVAKALSTPYQKYDSAAFQNVVPELYFREGLTILHEPAVAGYVNPRQLVEAQLILAQRGGATVIRQTVTAVHPGNKGLTLTTGQGDEIAAKKVLIAAGAWTQFLLKRPLGLIPKPRTILLARLSQAEAKRLENLPAIVFYAGLNNPHLDGVYMLPPIRYPDGFTYIKIGGKLKTLTIAQNSQQLQAWFQSNGSQIEAEALKEELFKLIPSLQADAVHVKPCVTTYTPSGEPLLEEIEPGQLYVAAGGCGAAAKSSNEIGRLAALMLMG